MKRWPIRWKLTVWNTAVLILILVGFASAMLVVLRGHLYERDDGVMAEELSELLEELGRYATEKELVQQLEQRFSIHSHYYFQLLNADGAVLFRSRFLSKITLPMPPHPEELRGRVFQDLYLPRLGHYRLLSLATRNSQGMAFLAQVITPRATLDNEFRSYLWMTLGLLSLGGIVAAISGYLLARWALDPINRIIGIAERISAHTLSERLEVTNSRDELGRLAATLNSMFDRLHRSVDEMRRFSADAAHELRSPLAVMRTEAEVVMRNTRSLSIYQRAIEVNLEETKRLSELVDQLLTLSRHDAGLPSEPQDDVQLDALIRDVADRLETLAVDKGVTLSIHCDQPCIVHGDDIGLSQLFFNLIDNAVKYTPAEQSVQLSLQVSDDHVRVVVEDTGIGIPAEHLPRIFDRFYRIDYSRNRDLGGAGLGLAICKSIVESHRGEILVTSEPGRGTRFVVILPRYGNIDSGNKQGARNVRSME